MKPVSFLGDTLVAIRAFPDGPRREAGFQINRVQRGLEPDHWKPMKAIGSGVREIRMSGAGGAYRVVYIATLADAVYILHAFQKKTRATPKRDIAIAELRYRELLNRFR